MKVSSTFIFQPTNRSSVEKLLKSVKTSKAASTDSMIKDAYKEVAYPICHLINGKHKNWYISNSRKSS